MGAGRGRRVAGGVRGLGPAVRGPAVRRGRRRGGGGARRRPRDERLQRRGAAPGLRPSRSRAGRRRPATPGRRAARRRRRRPVGHHPPRQRPVAGNSLSVGREVVRGPTPGSRRSDSRGCLPEPTADSCSLAPVSYDLQVWARRELTDDELQRAPGGPPDLRRPATAPWCAEPAPATASTSTSPASSPRTCRTRSWRPSWLRRRCTASRSRAPSPPRSHTRRGSPGGSPEPPRAPWSTSKRGRCGRPESCATRRASRRAVSTW